MIGKYQKNGVTAYYFKAYHGLDPLTGKKIQTFRRGFKTEREARLAEAKCITEYEKRHSEQKTPLQPPFYKSMRFGRTIIKTLLKSQPA